jgi:hypothetical protein
MLDRHYYVDQSKDVGSDKWDVCWMNNRRVVYNFADSKMAQATADALNQAFSDGKMYAREHMRERVTNLIMGDEH